MAGEGPPDQLWQPPTIASAALLAKNGVLVDPGIFGGDRPQTGDLVIPSSMPSLPPAMLGALGSRQPGDKPFDAEIDTFPEGNASRKRQSYKRHFMGWDRVAYDTTQDQVQNPNTKFVQPTPDTTTTVVPPDQKQALSAATPAPQPQQQQADFPPPSGASGQPQQGLVTAQSEPTPSMAKPAIDPRPLKLLKDNRPDDFDQILHAAQVTGTSPERLAAHYWAESRMNPDAPRGGDGEIGGMQLLPSTAAKYTAGGKLDPFNPPDNKVMAAMVVKDLDNKYGKDSFASVAHYNGSGPGADAYARRLMPGAPQSAEMQLHAPEGKMTAQGLVQAASHGGPDAFFHYAVQTAPAGMPTSDVWRQAEDHLVNAFLLKGDLEGAQHARDFVLQMSHAGANQYLMGAHQALTSGNGTAAAQMLAKAHAFFPDGTIGQFRSDGKNVWAETTDENNPGMRLGPSFQVTPESIAGMLNQTTDPQKYLQTLTAQQKAAAEARLANLHGDYYKDLPNERRYAADARAGATTAAAAIRGDATIGAAQIRADAQQGKPNNGLDREIEKEVENKYGELSDLPQEQRGRAAELYSVTRRAGNTGPQSDAIVRGLNSGSLVAQRGQDGRWGVFSKDNPGQPVALLPPGSLDKYAPPQPQAGHASPIGAGAATPYALGAGVTNNLSGTVMPQTPVSQSSALPVSAR